MQHIKQLCIVVLLLPFLWSCSSDSDDNNGGENDANGGNSGNGGGAEVSEADLVLMNRIDDATGFMVAFNSETETNVSNDNGVEFNPAVGIIPHDGAVYTVGSLYEDKVTKWTLDGTSFTKAGEFTTGEGAKASSIIFVNATKAYVVPLNLPELQIFNPSTMEKTGAIDLSAYALGEESDNNPNPTDGVIRDGKLFLGLAQIDTFETFLCQAGASMLIIDVETDTVEKHIQDDRACLTGALEPDDSIFMDELGDIYVNNFASFGYYPGLSGGYLRIKAGAEEFDPDYFFSITDLDLTGQVEGGKVSYFYRPTHVGDAIVYGNFWVPALSSNPPDFVNDKNYVAYKLDLRNQTAEPLDMPATTGWSASNAAHNGQIIFARTTEAGAGLYYYDPSSGTMIGDQAPRITTEGSPVWIEALK